MAMDLERHTNVIQPEWSMTIREIMAKHIVLRISLDDELAREAEMVALASGVGFNGDEKGVFDRYKRRLQRRPKFVNPNKEPEPVAVTVEDDEESDNLMLEMAEKVKLRNR